MRPAEQLDLNFARAPLRSARELLDYLQSLGLRHVARCVLTRNRTVMVSFDRGVLRVHQGYLSAPEHVLRAIVTFVQGRTRAERLAARRVIVSAAELAKGPPRAPVRSHPDDEAVVARLRELHAQLNVERFGGALRPVVIRVSRRMKALLGHYSPRAEGESPEIAISRRHLRRDGWSSVTETLLHEMVHQWQDESGLPLDHRAAFHRKAREVGAAVGGRGLLARLFDRAS